MKKVAFYTLGCKLNFSETSTIARAFVEKGYLKVDFEDTPDIFVINTCSVTENADKKCRKIVNAALNVSPQADVFVIGCYAQLKPEEIIQIPGVRAVLGANDKFRLIEILDEIEKKPETRIFSCDIERIHEFKLAYSINDRTRTFLKVQDGCNYSCSFCTIPLARGQSRSDSVENIVKAAQQIAEDGVKEIVLTGVNTGDFGLDQGIRKSSFYELIKQLDQVEGIERFRISSIEPNLLSDQIIEFVAASEKFVPHFHIPLQSGSDKILKLMRRRYLRQLYQERVHQIKNLMPYACIGADVIVGFPGETDDDFMETYQFINQLEVSYLHVFPYSERENTLAINLDGKVPMDLKNKRAKMLRNLSHKKRRKFYMDHLGSKRSILIEHDIQDGLMEGFTDNYIRIEMPYKPELVNKVIPAHLKNIKGNGKVAIDILEQEEVLNQ